MDSIIGNLKNLKKRGKKKFFFIFQKKKKKRKEDDHTEKKMQQPQIFNEKDCEDEIARFGSLEGRVSGLANVAKLQAAAFAPVVKCSNGPCPGPGTVNVASAEDEE
jgi:hypothetical protein